MQNVVDSIIQPDQVAFLKGRDIASLLRMVDDVVYSAQQNDIPGAMLAVDFKKAFDSISQEYMTYVFTKFGFGNELVRWVEILMKESWSCIGYGGWLSEEIRVEGGIRQGCCFSPLTFILGIELLAIKMRGKNGVHGIPINKSEDIYALLKIALYADDVTLFLRDRDDIKLALDILKQFASISGLEINTRKTEAMWLGSSIARGELCFDLNWKNKIKLLGIFFCNSVPASNLSENWESRIENMSRVISTWHRRNLGYLGKMCIINSFLVPQLVYVMRVINLSEKVLNRVTTMLYHFLWKRKTTNKKAFEKVKRCVLKADFEKGGLCMPDIKIMQQSFLLEWIRKLHTATDTEKWSFIPIAQFSQLGRDLTCFHAKVK
eukprot:GHVL01034894.1.p1 GENE.GHVL01034894.1~~GHVL01034894.1.p1  ORF type:complete len:377 (-),score=17.22 GHVL01034894.1:1234-2364(-)